MWAGAEQHARMITHTSAVAHAYLFIYLFVSWLPRLLLPRRKRLKMLTTREKLEIRTIRDHNPRGGFFCKKAEITCASVTAGEEERRQEGVRERRRAGVAWCERRR